MGPVLPLSFALDEFGRSKSLRFEDFGYDDVPEHLLIDCRERPRELAARCAAAASAANQCGGNTGDVGCERCLLSQSRRLHPMSPH